MGNCVISCPALTGLVFGDVIVVGGVAVLAVVDVVSVVVDVLYLVVLLL